MNDYTITMTKTVSREDIENICVTALEGGIGYWAQLNNANADWRAARKKHRDQPTAIVFARGLMDGIPMTFIDATGEVNDTWTMTIDDLLSGISQYYAGVDKKGHALGGSTLDFDDWDADHADCVFQLGIFGEEVFG